MLTLSSLQTCNVTAGYLLQGGTLFQVLDDVEPLPRDPLAPFRMSVIDRFKDMGTIAMGKSEAGLVRKNDRLYVMPNKCGLPISMPSAQTVICAPRCVRMQSFSAQACKRWDW